MKFTVVTIFPELFESALRTSLLGKAVSAGLVTVCFVDPRDFTNDRHRSVDDSPYGGGPGMVMKVEPLVAAIESAAPADLTIAMTPAGAPLTQSHVRAFSKLEHVVLVCGRYEGIDERVHEIAVDQEISIGDFVMTGGEIGALVIIDAVSRYVPGVLGESTSTDEESFSDGLLEYPQYTRPAEFRGHQVPAILQSGDHARIKSWRHAQSLQRTAHRRPDLLARRRLSDSEAKLVAGTGYDLAARTYIALVHYPVHDRTGAVVTSAVTTLDVHDIARSAATYGLAGYFVLNPIAAQREKVDRVLEAWGQDQKKSHDFREIALRLVRTAPQVEDAVSQIEQETGHKPFLVATSADTKRTGPDHCTGAEPSHLPYAQLATFVAREAPERPVLLIFGTGWGVTDELISQSDQLLEPIVGDPAFNHLSVRSAVAGVLDRLFGRRPW